VKQVAIPYEFFTLKNGLRVIVHEDRKAPVVGVSIWYNVGSNDEPAGQNGFAHLFEHLMFNGSENAQGDYFAPLREIGATDLNGSTWPDHTNYYQTVPTSALERALFLESDRMGHLLGAVTHENLTNQIAVVQNEKRQGDNEPFGLAGYAQAKALFPEGNPYRNPTVGSLADLSTASLDAVHSWFRVHYGPNNAILSLAGDIDAAEARLLAERYFGHIRPGPRKASAPPTVPSLPRRVDQTLRDKVANTRLYRNWVVPGLADRDHARLIVAAAALGGLASSRLGNSLIRQDQAAVRVNGYVQPFRHVGVFEVQVDVKPGQDPAAVSRKLDEIIAGYIRTGPTQDEVRRSVMQSVSWRVQNMEQVGGMFGKSGVLAEGLLYAGDPTFYRTRLRQFARMTPAEVRAAMQRWLTSPVYALRVDPGEREGREEAIPAPATANPAVLSARHAAVSPRAARPLPPVKDFPRPDFPEVERARLSNGIEVIYARRPAVPTTLIALEFNAGAAADPAHRLGTQALTLNLLKEGTRRLNSVQLAEAQERLGTKIGTEVSLDRTAVTLAALTPNLAPSLDLLADVVRNPAFELSEVERLRNQQLATIAAELTQPNMIAARTLPRLLFGSEHPYGRPFTGTGDPDAVRSLTRDELIQFHRTWIRPDNATIFAVGDQPLDQLVPLLEGRFGDWRSPGIPQGRKQFDAALPPQRPRVFLIDRPQSPQSYILAGQILPLVGTEDLLSLTAANEALGGNFLARINMDLRERRGWSYGARGGPTLVEHQLPYLIRASVQADRTGDSIQAIIEQVQGFLSANGVQPQELDQIIRGNTRQLPGQFETSLAVLGALRSNALHRRPDNYWKAIGERYRSMTVQPLDQAARAAIKADNFVWIVVGEAQRVRPQLERLGLPVALVQPQ
jgi:predicted Zn-dependent peptidase